MPKPPRKKQRKQKKPLVKRRRQKKRRQKKRRRKKRRRKKRRQKKRRQKKRRQKKRRQKKRPPKKRPPKKKPPRKKPPRKKPPREEAAEEEAAEEEAAEEEAAEEEAAEEEAAEEEAAEEEAAEEEAAEEEAAEEEAAEEEAAEEEAAEETAEEAADETTEEAADETTEEAADETTEEAADETTEETAEETTEEAAEETTEEAAEETTEEAAEETTEEAAEETTEEAAEETTEEAAEEASEEAAEAGNSEETAEAATEETAEAATEETAEAATEETAEAAAEETPEAATEETAEAAAEETPEAATEETAEAAAEETPEAATEETAEAATEETPEAAAGETAEATENAAAESTTENTTEDAATGSDTTTDEASPDTASQETASEDSAQEAAPDTAETQSVGESSADESSEPATNEDGSATSPDAATETSTQETAADGPNTQSAGETTDAATGDGASAAGDAGEPTAAEAPTQSESGNDASSSEKASAAEPQATSEPQATAETSSAAPGATESAISQTQSATNDVSSSDTGSAEPTSAPTDSTATTSESVEATSTASAPAESAPAQSSGASTTTAASSSESTASSSTTQSSSTSNTQAPSTQTDSSNSLQTIDTSGSNVDTGPDSSLTTFETPTTTVDPVVQADPVDNQPAPDPEPVLPPDNSPVALDDALLIANTAPIDLNSLLLENDFDPDEGQSPTLLSVSNATDSALIANNNGTFSYTPDAELLTSLGASETSTQTLNYTITSGDRTDTAVVNITYQGENDAPIASADAAETDEDNTLILAVLSNDTDADTSDTLRISAVDDSTLTGTVRISDDDTNLIYEPPQDLSDGQRVEVLTYQVTDGTSFSEATVTITVFGINDPPVIVSDPTQFTLDLPPAGGEVEIPLSAIFSDADLEGELTVLELDTSTTKGTVRIGSVLYDAGDAFDYLDDGEFAIDSFGIAVEDEIGQQAAGTFGFQIAGVNDAPEATADLAVVAENESLDIAADAGVLNNDNDIDIEPLTVVGIRTGLISGTGTPGSIATAITGTYGTLTLAADGSYTYAADQAQVDTLAEGASGVDVFTYTTSDGDLTDTAEIRITVTGTNDVPQAAPDTAEVTENGAITIAALNGALANDTDIDVDGTALTVSGIRTGATNETGVSGAIGSGLTGTYGTLTLAADGSYTYAADQAQVDTLAEGASGVDVFTYTTSDGDLTDTAEIRITVTGTNDVPQAAPDTAEVTENGAITIAALNGALANDTDIDVDGTALTVSGIRTGATNETGVSGAIGSGLTGTYGTLTLAADGSYTYAADQAQVDTLAEGASGVDVFTYTTSDGDLTDTAEIRITVTGTNDVPQAAPDTAEVTENGAITIAALNGALANDTDIDVDGTALTVSGIRTGATNETGVSGAIGSGLTGTYGTLTLAADGSYTYAADQAQVDTLAEGASGVDVFTYTTSDGDLTDTAEIRITVTGTNDVPQAAPDTAEVTENGAITIAALNGALANDTDIDVGGTALTVSGIRTGATTETGVSGAIGSGLTGTYGTLTLAADGSYTYAADQAQVDTLAEGASGVDVFTYTTSDGDLTDTAEIRITVTGTNDQADYFGATSASISAGTGSTIQTGVILGFDVDSNPGLSSTPVVAGAEGHGLFYIVHAGTTALNTRIGTASENPSDPLANLPQQQVFSNVSVLPGNDQSYSIDFFYNTTDQDPDLPGLGLRVHYNSALISEVVLTPINTGLLGVSDQADTLDFDNDPTTDRFVLVGWADISNQNWPSFTNAPIFNLSFEANMPADSVTTTSINLSGEPVEGYELSAYSVHLVNGPFVAEFNNQGYLSSDQWVYVPNDGVLEALGDGEQLIDNYQFTASDGSRQSVTVTLLGANDAPEFTGDATAQIRPGETYALEFDDLAVGDPDTPAEALTFTVLDSVGGSLAVDGQPSTTFTLAEISAGQVTFTDAVSDETAPSFTFVVEDTNEDDSSPTQHTFDFEMQPNTAPVFNQDDPIATSSGQVLLITVATLLANDIDVEGDPITVLEVNSLSLQGGTVSYDGVTISYEAPDKFSGDDQIFYTISDGFGGETQASLEISVGIAQDKLSPTRHRHGTGPG